MLKRRLIATLLIKNNLVVQSLNFKQFLPVGSLSVSLQFLQRWDVDEILILDIDATTETRVLDFEFIKECTKNIFVPITVGGGIKSLHDIESALYNGADKICINSALFGNQKLIKEASSAFGSQCVVAVTDVKSVDNTYFSFSHGGKIKQSPLTDWISMVQSLGCGEILINSINHDGSKNGFDIDIYKSIEDYRNIPVIAMGGAGEPYHIVELFEKTEVDAAAVGNMLHFREHSTAKLKSFLRYKKCNIRNNSQIDYSDAKFSPLGNVLPVHHPSLYFTD